MRWREEDLAPLGLPDLIRLNRLVRGGVDIDGFLAWHSSLPRGGQAGLLNTLCEFAHQAGVDDGVRERARRAAGLPAGDPAVERVAGLAGGSGLAQIAFIDWLVALPPAGRLDALRFLAHLFGDAEGRAYAACRRSPACNHWWHRDLQDERVVRALLADPEYWRTGPLDDESL